MCLVDSCRHFLSKQASTEPCSCVDCPLSCPVSDNSIYGPSTGSYYTIFGVDVFVLGAVIVFFVAVVASFLGVRMYKKKMRTRGQ